MTKHSAELAETVVSVGGVGALVDHAGAARGKERLPAIMALGFVAAFSPTLALAVIGDSGLART